jgi:hypothetical protein
MIKLTLSNPTAGMETIPWKLASKIKGMKNYAVKKVALSIT